MMENKNYISYVRKVFSYFDGCKQREGLYLYRTLYTERTKYTAQDYNQMLFTIYNLVDQGYLKYKEGDFIVLTQDGMTICKVVRCHTTKSISTIW